MTIASIVTRGRGFGRIPALVTHGLESGATPTPTPTPTGLLGGGPGKKRHEYSYIQPYQKYRDESEKISQKIAQAEIDAEREKKRLEREDTENLARQLEAVDASLREEITRLSLEKAALIRRIDDEEAILVLTLSNPFI